MDRISVIVPVYKTEKYLDRCVQSIVDQTYKELEIILVDDESPDNCPEICDEWAKRDGRIKALHIKNKGVANARNTALQIASGKYTAFVDSDDYIEPDMLETLLNALKENCADIAVCGFTGGDYDEASLETPSREKALELTASGDYVFGVLWNKLYKSDIAKGAKMPPLTCCEDQVFNYFAIKSAASIACVKDKKYNYQLNEDSTSKQSFNIGAFDAVKAKEIILGDCAGTKPEQFAVKGLIDSCFVVLSGALKAGGYNRECAKLRRIILKHRGEINSSSLYSKKTRLKTAVLSLSLGLYSKFITGGK